MPYSHKYIDDASTTVVSSKDEGVLHAITVGTTTLGDGSITITDNTGTISTLGVIDGIVVQNSYLYDIAYTGFLQIVTGTPMEVTVCYN